VNLTLLLVTTLAKLSGHPLVFSSVAVPDTDPDSVVIEPDPKAQIKPGRGSRSIKGVEYAEYARKLKMDLLIPEGPGPHPLVLYLPGGGFVSARRMIAGKQRRYVADAGFVVASIDYRTTTAGATYREGLMDVATALRFLRDHAAEYGIDPTRVAVWGESAGGYMTSMAATEPDNKLTAAVDFFGASNLDEISQGFDAKTVAAMSGPDSAIAAYVLGPGRSLADHPDEARQADPASRVTAQTPPFLIVHGDDDRLIPPAQTARLHQALLAAGVSSTRYVVKGGGHGDLSRHPEPWTSSQLMDRVVDFLRTHLSAHGG
jgi:acetyl esterase/lipase